MLGVNIALTLYIFKDQVFKEENMKKIRSIEDVSIITAYVLTLHDVSAIDQMDSGRGDIRDVLLVIAFTEMDAE